MHGVSNILIKNLMKKRMQAAHNMITEVFIMKANAPLYLGRESLAKEVDFLLTGVLPDGLKFPRNMLLFGEHTSTKSSMMSFS